MFSMTEFSWLFPQAPKRKATKISYSRNTLLSSYLLIIAVCWSITPFSRSVSHTLTYHLLTMRLSHRIFIDTVRWVDSCDILQDSTLNYLFSSPTRRTFTPCDGYLVFSKWLVVRNLHSGLSPPSLMPCMAHPKKALMLIWV